MTPFFAIIFIWAFAYVATLLLYWQGWNRRRVRVGLGKSESGSEEGIGVSIVVPFRNEEKNLPACIASLKKLDYPRDLYEIIFVNDHSTDSSAESARSAGEKFLELGEDEFGKKAALTKAISSAKFSAILTLDADSVVPSQWLKTMTKTMQTGNYLAVGGLVVFKKEDGFLNAFLNVEMCSLMGMTAGGINNKKPLLANGTNLMFSKEAFIEVKGYEGDGYASGDDVFLVQKIAKKYGPNRIGFNNEEESIVATQGVTNLSALFHQRARWAGKSKAYSFSGKFTTILLGSFNILMALLIILAIFQPHMIPFVFAMFFLKLAADTILTLPVLLRTNQIYLMKYLIPVALLYSFYILGTALLSMFIKPVWKGRSV
jgi:biofilm PGA synthesis N-glycosyltransferase PgaC